MSKRDRDATPPTTPTESGQSHFLQEQLKQAHTAASKLLKDNIKKDLMIKELEGANKKLKTELNQTKDELSNAQWDIFFTRIENDNLL